NEAQATTNISNQTTASNTGPRGTRALSLNAVAALNEIRGSAEASISYTGLPAAGSGVSAGGGVGVSATDHAGITATITLTSDARVPTGTGTGGLLSSATGEAGAVAFNDVRGGASAHADSARLTATGGAISVTADETSVIQATTESQLLASLTMGGTDTNNGQQQRRYGPSGKSLGASGIVATNTVISAASATATGSNFSAPAGDVSVTATNGATLTAKTINSASTSLTGTATTKPQQGPNGPTTFDAYDIGVTLAFNSIGWEPQNVLFNGLDALLG